jgi:hypothetical protein
VHGWLKRCIDSFESKLDAERLWQEYYATLDEDGRRCHHRLNIKLTDTLPFMEIPVQWVEWMMKPDAFFMV